MFSDDFDKTKSAKTKEERGIDFVEARAIWNDPNRVNVPAKTVGTETRTATVGFIENKLWVSLWTMRPSGKRIFSVRRAEGTPFERAYYGKK